MTIKRNELKGILTGMMLGDSCLTTPKGCINTQMRIQHSLAQEEYMKYKQQLLSEFIKTNINYIKGKYPGVAIKTRTHPLFTRMNKMIYPNGKKTVTKTWLNWLTPLGLALFYMDDGSLNKSYSVNKSGRRRIFKREIFLHTCSFSLEENQLIADFIKEKFGINFRIKKNGIYYRLQIGAIEANKFIEIVRPYIIPSMQYKIDMQYEK